MDCAAYGIALRATKNPNCDGVHCYRKDGEVRLVPTGGGGNAILCLSCYMYEMTWRQEENTRLGYEAYELPEWETLKVYKEV